jgi:hypothetical protein
MRSRARNSIGSATGGLCLEVPMTAPIVGKLRREQSPLPAIDLEAHAPKRQLWRDCEPLREATPERLARLPAVDALVFFDDHGLAVPTRTSSQAIIHRSGYSPRSAWRARWARRTIGLWSSRC